MNGLRAEYINQYTRNDGVIERDEWIEQILVFIDFMNFFMPQYKKINGN
jgi:hypothetical protein